MCSLGFSNARLTPSVRPFPTRKQTGIAVAQPISILLLLANDGQWLAGLSSRRAGIDGTLVVTNLSGGIVESRFFVCSEDFIRKGRKNGTNIS